MQTENLYLCFPWTLQIDTLSPIPILPCYGFPEVSPDSLEIALLDNDFSPFLCVYNNGQLCVLFNARKDSQTPDHLSSAFNLLECFQPDLTR